MAAAKIDIIIVDICLGINIEIGFKFVTIHFQTNLHIKARKLY